MTTRLVLVPDGCHGDLTASPKGDELGDVYVRAWPLSCWCRLVLVGWEVLFMQVRRGPSVACGRPACLPFLKCCSCVN